MHNPFKAGDIVQPKKYSGTELDESRTYEVERALVNGIDLVGVKKRGLSASHFVAVAITPKPPEPGFIWQGSKGNWVKDPTAKGLDGTEKPEDWVTGNALTKPEPVAALGQAGGLKFDAGKDEWNLLLSGKGMIAALRGVVRVLMFGAKKYAAHSWREVEDNERRYLDGLMRHYAAIMEEGLQSIDPESGQLHIDHLNCNGLFLGELARKAEDAKP